LTGNIASGQRLGAAFTAPVSAEALQSAAVDHPYLRAMRHGDFPDVRFALRDFAIQYGLYSAKFADYVSAVIANLSHDKHKEILSGNLAEEKGDTHGIELPPDVMSSVDGVPHPILYRRFQEALGIDLENVESTENCPGAEWSQRFLALCETNEHVGAGAIGIGTEYIVAKIFDQTLDGLKTHTELSRVERVFFDLHSVCDDKHAAEMLTITEDLALDQKSCDEIQFGVSEAIRLRSEFWDRLLERANSVPVGNEN